MLAPGRADEGRHARTPRNPGVSPTPGGSLGAAETGRHTERVSCTQGARGTERRGEEARLPGWSARALSPSRGSNLGPPSVLGHGRVSSPLCLQNQAPWCGLPVPPLLLGGSLGSQADGGSQTP